MGNNLNYFLCLITPISVFGHTFFNSMRNSVYCHEMERFFFEVFFFVPHCAITLTISFLFCEKVYILALEICRLCVDIAIKCGKSCYTNLLG